MHFGRSICGDLAVAERREWLVTNGLGGFAAGTIAGTLTRRYHGLLVAALEPPLGRMLLATKFDETASYAGEAYDLAANRWTDASISPRGYTFVDSFHLEGTTPHWTFALGEALLEKSVWMEAGANTTYVRYEHRHGAHQIALRLRAFVNYRDFHANTHAGDWRMSVATIDDGVRVEAYAGARPLFVRTERGTVMPEHVWYRDYALACETERGLDDRDDNLAVASFALILEPGASLTLLASDVANAAFAGARERCSERERDVLATWRAAHGDAAAPAWLERCVLAADQFVVTRRVASAPVATSVIAGYPWFGPWGRDTMIALRGLTLLTGRPEIARSILVNFGAFVADGLLPNYFPDGEQEPQYNTADASLWYLEACAAYVAATDDRETLRTLWPMLVAIVAAYEAGTRFGIGCDPADGLIRAGAPGLQLTWMDAKVGDWVVTPRIGKPIELSALWYNGLQRMAALAPLVHADGERFVALAERTRAGFERFWNEATASCFDVIDGAAGNDAALRPNALFAVALPFSPLDARRQRAVVERCGERLFAGTGLRSLDPRDPAYVGHYGGSPRERDGAYHQGTSWLYLLGIYATAHARAFGDVAAARALLDAYDDALRDGAVGTLGEIADGDPPFTPRGAIAQAWSIATAIASWYDIPAYAPRATAASASSKRSGTVIE